MHSRIRHGDTTKLQYLFIFITLQKSISIRHSVDRHFSYPQVFPVKLLKIANVHIRGEVHVMMSSRFAYICVTSNYLRNYKWKTFLGSTLFQRFSIKLSMLIWNYYQEFGSFGYRIWINNKNIDLESPEQSFQAFK